MSTDYNDFSLNKGKAGKIDLENLKGGLKRGQIHPDDKNLLAIFDAIDDGNHVLDANEVSQLKTMLKEYAKNTNLSNKEANKYLKSLFGDKKDITVTKEDLYRFLNGINNNSNNVKKSTVLKENGHQVIQTEYADGSIEKYIPEEKKRVIIKNNKTSTYDDKNNILSEEYFDEEGNAVKTLFSENKPSKTVKTLKDNKGTETYSYNAEGKPQLDKKVEVGTDGVETVTTYEYGEGGTVKETVNNGTSTVQTVKKGEQVLSSHTTVQDGDNTIETVTDEHGNVTETTFNSDGKRVKQVKTVDGETYTVEYDGKGNTKIIVQNGESISKIAKLFNVPADSIKDLNADKIKHKGSYEYFLVGEEIVIAGELEADDPALKGRKSREETIGDYVDDAEARAREAEERRRRRAGGGDGDGGVTPTPGGGDDDGVEPPRGGEDEDPTVRRQREQEEIKRNAEANKVANDIAKNLYKACDDNAAAINKEAFWKHLRRVDSSNVLSVLDHYDKVLQEHTGDSSLMDTICSETGASEANRKKALNHILTQVAKAAEDAGVPAADIQHAKDKFTKSMNLEFDEIGTINPAEMEKAIDFLRGAAVAAKLTKDAEAISDEEAMKTFVGKEATTDENGETTEATGLVKDNADVQKTYKDARESEGWAAKTGDWVCGLFGCTTIDDMDAKLGTHAKDVKKLVAAADKKDTAEFKKLYKEIFGVDFNPKRIQARQTAQENYEAAAGFDAAHQAFTALEQKTKNMDYNATRNEIMNTFDYNAEEMEAIVANYAANSGMSAETDADKKKVLDLFLSETKDIYKHEFEKLSEGKTLDQMAKDVELLTKSAYGTKDIVKDVITFNENQQMTDMIATSAAEIAGTIALQFVPGLGQVAAARLAVSAAKWGAKGVKIATMAAKAGNAAAKLQKIQTASKKAMVATQMVNAGVATAAVNLSDKKSVEETLRKTLMNMSFAGVGATSSILAPKLMQSFGIVDRALANELAEEIINVAGSYGVTKLSGSDYTTADGFIDIVTGLTIARLSHIKTGKLKPDKVKPDIDGPAVVPPKPDVDEGGGAHSKVDPDKDLGGETKVDPFKKDAAQLAEEAGFPDIPTPENPQIFKVMGADISIENITINSKGQTVLHSADGTKLTLDKYNRPVLMQKDGLTGTLEYDSPTDKIFSKGVTKNKKNQIVSIVESKGDTFVSTDYEHCMEVTMKKTDDFSTFNPTADIISHRFIPLAEYPAGAKIPDPDAYSQSLKMQIDECTSLDKLNDLKSEYSMYNANYGKTDDLYDVFINKTKELEALKGNTVVPHKPLSKLMTSTAFDDALKNLPLKKYGVQGMPLKYSHNKFIGDLKSYLDKLPDSERKAIMSEFNIQFKVDMDGATELVDIPKLSAIPSTQAEQDVMDILNKYAKQNELMISDPAIKTELENFIKDVPEFAFIIGKSQNSVHKYTVESHTLQNLQKALKYADDANLSDSSKEVLKMSIMLHDLGKQFKGSSVSDTGHAALSKQYAEQILERFDYPQATKDKILNLIENHHWFKEFNKGNMSAQDVIDMFGEDLELAKIMAKADLESVSDDFHLAILEPGKKLTPAEYETKFNEKMKQINNSIDVDLIGKELPIGALDIKNDYILDFNKFDKLKVGNQEIDVNDPKLRQLIKDLKEGDSFAIGCNNPPTHYDDVKYQIGEYPDVGSHHVVISKKNGEIVITPRKEGVEAIKYIPTKVNSNPVIAKKVEELRHKASKITSETLNIDGKNVQFEILHGTQGGSNKGYYVVNKETGDLYYAKESGPKGKVELLANKLYEMAGVGVPEMSAFKTTLGENGTLSKFVPEANPITSANAAVNDAFGMHALLANWDAVCSNNTLLTKDGKAVMIDAGGSFDYHAQQSGSKPFTAIPMEVTTLIDPNINGTSAQIFSKMSREDAIKSLQKAVSLKDSDITKLLDSMGLSHYKDTLLKRKKFMKAMLDEMKSTPQGSKSMLDYMTKIKEKTMFKFIDDAKSVGDLEDVKNALATVQDSSVKNKMIDKINARQKYLDSIAPKPQILSSVQVKNLLVKNGFVQSPSGYYVKSLDAATKQKYHDAYGSYGSQVIHKIEQPLSASDIKNIEKMLNVAGGKYSSMWAKDMDALIQLYRNIENSDVFSISNMTDEHWEAIYNIGKAKPITADQLADLTYYKGSGYIPINDALTNLKKHGKPVPPSLQSKIDHIQQYIGTQILDKPIKVWRGEGPEVLASVKTKSGKSLDQAMEEAKKHYLNSGSAKDDSKIKELIKEILGNNYVATQERFMSTSMRKNGGFSGEIRWELTVQKGSKGVFLEGVNVNGAHQCECEFLVQKDSQIKITDIKYDYDYNRWVLEGDVSN